MAVVSFAALKGSLEEYVRRAAAGETVTIMAEGQVVAELRPVQSTTHPPGLEEAMQPYDPVPREGEYLTMKDQPENWEERGIRQGWLRPAKRSGVWPPPRQPVPGLTLEKLLEELDRDREDRA